MNWKDWKTSLAGIIAGVASVILPVVQGGAALHTADWVTALFIALTGVFASDSKKEVTTNE